MVERADSDGDGLVTLEDFYNIMTKKTFAWNYLHKIKFICIKKKELKSTKLNYFRMLQLKKFRTKKLILVMLGMKF